MKVPDSRPFLVQKYGGTSLGKQLDTICGSIIPQFQVQHRVIVVCSALSGATKASGMTSLLMRCIDYAMSGLTAQSQLSEAVDILLRSHIAALDLAFAFCVDSADYGDTRNKVETECEGLRTFLLAAQIVGELSSRARDSVLGLGERLSCVVVAACLRGKGYAAKPVILDHIVESAFGPYIHEQQEAFERLGPRFYHVLAKAIRTEIQQTYGDDYQQIPVVTGFFGTIPGSLVQVIGRGYSDLCAAMCAVGCNATELQIWKEVDGIFTADPQKVPSARLLSTVTVDEATELMYRGCEVIHPKTLDHIRCANIVLRLKNVFDPNNDGTVIYPAPCSQPPALAPPDGLQEPLQRKQASSGAGVILRNIYHNEACGRDTPTAVTVKNDICLINVGCNTITNSLKLLSRVSSLLEQQCVSVDLVTTSERSVSLTIQNNGHHQGLSRVTPDLDKFGSVTVTHDMSTMTVVGLNPCNTARISSEILSVLASARIDIFMFNPRPRGISVSILVKTQDAILALNLVHGRVLGIATHWEQQSTIIKGPWLY